MAALLIFFKKHKVCFLVGTYFAAFSLLVLFSNSNDWDQAFSFLEVDRHSWLQDFHIPLWSYQLCGGMSRLGDPQAFGLSPFFVLPLALGPFLGAKVLVLLCAAIGFIYLRRTLVLLRPVSESPAPFTVTAFSLLVIFQNYFLGNFYAGHLVFVNAYLLWSVIYYFLLAMKRPLRRGEFAAGVFFSASLYLGGIHYVLLFLLLPTAVFVVILGAATEIFLLIRRRVRGFHQFLARVLKASSFHTVGFLIGAVKIYYVMAYQAAFPRTLWSRVPEIYDPLMILHFLFVPTWGSRFVDGWIPVAPWGIWEFSFFSLILILVVILAVSRAGRRPAVASLPRSTKIFFGTWILFGLFCLVLAWGDFASWAPFSEMDKILFTNSLRVPVRYIFPFLLGAPVAAYLLMPAAAMTPAKLSAGIGFVAILGLLNFAGFSPFLSGESVSAAWNIPRNTAPMHVIAGGALADMYEPVMAGMATLNCYVPMRRPGLVWDVGAAIHMEFIDGLSHQENPTCLRDSYFTENQIFISPACSPNVCINLNAVNMYENTPFIFDPIQRRYCRRDH